MRFFFYGTLLDPDVRRAVLGTATEAGMPAALDGWRRVFVRGDCYPVIRPARGSTVDGMVFAGVNLEGARLLRQYEGPSYRERRLTVRGADGGIVSAAVFVPKDAGVATGGPWTLASWRVRHKRPYLRRDGLVAAARGRAPLDR
ncbi:hypothetical protein ABIE65_002207 [Constrictibacter sp. MBR-5]|uniref:gamma-glutamylcyclotransferase family protein n=1 Tax=Constrictibacter sp. MBR-5 TaxID=3156467 RepID=UPI00339862B4